MKRILSWILIVALVAGMVPAVQAEEDRYLYDGCILYTKDDWGVTIVGYNENLPAEVTIPAEIDGVRVKTIKGRAFDGCTWLTAIHLPEGLLEVYEMAFRNTGLSGWLEIPSTVHTFRDNALMNTPNLLGIRFLGEPLSIGYDPDLRIVMMTQAWFDVKGYSLGRAGRERIFVTDAEAGDFLNGHLTEQNGIRYLVCDEYSYLLRGVDQAAVTLPDAVEGKPTRWIMDNAFEQCQQLRSITFPNGLERIRRCAFQSTDLRTLNLPASCVRLDTNAFYGLFNLTSADLTHVTWIGDNAFTYAGLKTVTLGAGLTELGDSAFSWTKLTQIDVPASVPTLSNTFYGCQDLAAVTLHEGLTAFYGAVSACPKITSLTLPATVADVSNLALDNGLTTVEIPGAVKTLHANAIHGGDHVTLLILNEGLETIEDGAFVGTEALTVLRLPASVTLVRHIPNIKNLVVYFHTGTQFELGTGTHPSIQFINVDTDEEVPVNLRVTENGLTYMIRWDHAELIASSSQEDVLVIPDYVQGYPVTIIEKNAIKNLPCNRLVLPETVKLIRPLAVIGCTNLFALALPASLEAVEDENGNSETIGASPFEGYFTYIVQAGTWAEGYANRLAASQPAGIQFYQVLTYEGENPYRTYGNHVFVVEDGEAALLCAIRRDDVNGVDRVPGYVDELPVTAVLEGAYQHAAGAYPGNMFKTIVFQPPLRTIGANLFTDNSASVDIYIPETVTEIADDAFTAKVDRLHGKAGTLVETYAAAHGDEFVLMELPFLDVEPGKWYYNPIRYCYQAGYMAGVSADAFNPRGTVTRAMLVQVLYSIAGNSMTTTMDPNYVQPFEDVKPGKWYYEAIRWAAYYEIVAGTSPTTFSPAKDITREQVAAILYRFARGAGLDHGERADLSGFSDQDRIAAYAKDALRWAVAVGMLSGYTDSTIRPKGTTTRAELAAMIMHFAELLYAEP